MKHLKLHVVLVKEEDGGYSAWISELPGCVSQGETKTQTLKNINEAKKLYLEELASEKPTVRTIKRKSAFGIYKGLARFKRVSRLNSRE